MTTYKNGDAGHVAFSVTGAGGVDVSELSSSYTVTYDANGGTGTAPTDTTEYIKDDTVTVKDAGNLVKTGYVFAGWNTQADGSGKAYIANDIFTISTENIVICTMVSRNKVLR